MVTSWQAVKSVATRRPTVETRNSWLNLLNFMRFLRCGPSGSSPRKTRLGCPVDIVKARYGVLLPAPFRALGRFQTLSSARRRLCHCAESRRWLLADYSTSTERIAKPEACRQSDSTESRRRRCQESWQCKENGWSTDRFRWPPAATPLGNCRYA